MNIIDTIPINEKDHINVYGTIDNPLFRCSEVLINLLRYAESNKNRFYYENKTISRYIVTLADCEAILGTHYNAKSIRYFTELGLYRCLFTSESSVAIDFEEQVAILLKDLRLGKIKLQEQRECEFMRLSEDHNSILMSLMEIKNELEIREEENKKQHKQIIELSEEVDSLLEENDKKQIIIRKCTKECVLYAACVYDSDSNLIGIYGGSSIQKPEDRFKEHRSNSCNRFLREAINNGNRVEFKLIGEFEYTDDNERKEKERDLILSINKNIRLNIQLPRPNSKSQPRSIGREHDIEDIEANREETKQPIELSNLNTRERVSFPVELQNLKTFLENEERYPNKRSDNEQEAKLGRFVDTLRLELSDPEFKEPISQFNRDLLFKEIPDFIVNDKEHQFRQNILKLAKYLSDNANVYPTFAKGCAFSERNTLAKFLSHLRESFKHPEKGSIKLTEQRLTFIAEHIPQFNWNDDPFFELRLLAEEIDAFVEINERLPRSNQNTAGDLPDEEIKLGFRVWNLINSLRATTVSQETSEAKREFLEREFPTVYKLIINRLSA